MFAFDMKYFHSHYETSTISPEFGNTFSYDPNIEESKMEEET